MLPTLPRPGSGLQTVPGTGPALPSVPTGAPDPAVFADAVARYRALERLRRFRQSLYECLDARADALFELADAVLACHDYSEDCCCPGVRQALDELFPEGGELTNSLFVVRR